MPRLTELSYNGIKNRLTKSPSKLHTDVTKPAIHIYIYCVAVAAVVGLCGEPFKRNLEDEGKTAIVYGRTGG